MFCKCSIARCSAFLMNIIDALVLSFDQEAYWRVTAPSEVAKW
jgi:hypothetical protein